MSVRRFASNPVGTHRINAGRQMVDDPDTGKPHPYRVVVLGCSKCVVTRDDKGGGLNVECRATIFDNPNGHPSVVIEMERIEDA